LRLLAPAGRLLSAPESFWLTGSGSSGTSRRLRASTKEGGRVVAEQESKGGGRGQGEDTEWRQGREEKEARKSGKERS